ncbi:MAG TPA: DUF885 family protein [Actinomycetota bacterium]
MNPRLKAICDLDVAVTREYVGLHDDYDGYVPDLSPDGVRARVARLGLPGNDGDLLTEPDPHDETRVRTVEAALRYELGELQSHRRNPLWHIAELDLSSYDRDYAPAGQRAEARHRHLATWPDAIDAAIASLDRIPAPVAVALLPAARGLAAGLDGDRATLDAALAAHQRFVVHLEAAAEHGDPDPALGRGVLERLLSAREATAVDLGRLEERADAERDRLRALLTDACGRLQAGTKPAEIVAELLRDHPDAGGVLDEAQAATDEVIAFTIERGLVPGLDGACLVAPAPPSRRWALAMMSWAAPYEADAPSRYYISPPDPSWPAEEQGQWLAVFSRTSLPAITAHEVAPGHFAHGRCIRKVSSDVRRTLHSDAFVEGWAHYAEELCLEEGLRATDPRFAAGVALEALQRVTRLAVSIGLHSGTMPLDEAIARFEADAFVYGPAARAEATRATFDPTYGRYTWGKLEILRLREQAKATWGSGYSVQRFNAALLALGSPPLGLMEHALS